MVFYIASDKEMPLVSPQNWDEVDTKEAGWESKVVPFSVELLDDTNRIVVERFDFPVVRYAGSFEGCGCGFGVCVIDEDSDPPDEHELAGRTSREHLYDYVVRNGVRTLYCCWSGDEKEPVEHTETLIPEQILDFHFEFKERGFYTIQTTANKRMESNG